MRCSVAAWRHLLFHNESDVYPVHLACIHIVVAVVAVVVIVLIVVLLY